VGKVTRALKKVDGIVDAKVKVGGATIQVTDSVADQQLIDAIKKAGFSAKVSE